MPALMLRALVTALPSSYLGNTTNDLVRRVITRARCDVVQVVETPLASNRGTEIDEYNTRAHAPLGSYWCASALSAWWEDAGLQVPRTGRASCDSWMAWGKETGRWSATPALGAAVLYGVPGDANHIGLVVRLSPVVLSIEGNTSINPGFDRNGVAVMVKQVNLESTRILGYVLPFPPVAQVLATNPGVS